MLKVIKYMNFPDRGFSGNYFMGLRHASCLIDFPLVVYLDFYLNSIALGYTQPLLCIYWSTLRNLLIVVPNVLLRFKWHLYFNNLDVVLFSIRSMGANK